MARKSPTIPFGRASLTQRMSDDCRTYDNSRIRMVELKAEDFDAKAINDHS